MAALSDEQIHMIIIGLLSLSIFLVLYHMTVQMKKENYGTTNAAYVTFSGQAATSTGFPLVPSSKDLIVAQTEMGITQNPWIGQSNISFPTSTDNAI